MKHLLILLVILITLPLMTCACDEESLQAGQNIKDIITNAGESLTPEDMSRLKEEAAKIQIPTEVPTMTPTPIPTPHGVTEITRWPTPKPAPWDIPAPVLTSMNFTVGEVGDGNDLMPKVGEIPGIYLRVYAYDQDGKIINRFNPPSGSKITFTVSAGGKILNGLSKDSKTPGRELIRTWDISNEMVYNIERIWGDTLTLIKDESITLDFVFKGGDGVQFTGSVTKPRTYLIK